MKFCFISDTHSLHNEITLNMEGVDFLVCTGDFTNKGDERDVHKFNKWLGGLPHKYKIPEPKLKDEINFHQQSEVHKNHN